MFTSPDEIELLIAKAKQNDELKTATKELEKRIFDEEVDLSYAVN